LRAEVARLGSQPVTIVAVTKGFGSDAIRAAVAAGLTDVGEKPRSGSVQKQDALGDVTGIRWHLNRAPAAQQGPAGARPIRAGDWWIRWTLHTS